MYHIYKITSNTVVDFAAEELKKYLRMMMPRCGDIPIDYDPNATEGFRLGLMADFGLSTAEETDQPQLDDIVHMDTEEEGGIIAGSNYRSVLLAVYEYLKKNGCRWLFPGVDGEFIPIREIQPVQYHKKADLRYRGQCNEGAENQQCMLETIDFSPKIGLNVYMIEFDIPKIYYDWFKEILGDKTPYYLRHTFSTVCQQYVRPDIVDIWMGDSPQRLVGKVYTHFPDEFMYEQMQKVEFPLL